MLDLALSSLGCAVSASVVPAIADHDGVLVTVCLPTPRIHIIERSVWDYKKADWNALQEALSKLDFDVLRFTDVDVAVASFVAMVLSEARKFIPMRVLKEFKEPLSTWRPLKRAHRYFEPRALFTSTNGETNCDLCLKDPRGGGP